MAALFEHLILIPSTPMVIYNLCNISSRGNLTPCFGPQMVAGILVVHRQTGWENTHTHKIKSQVGSDRAMNLALTPGLHTKCLPIHIIYTP